MPQYEQARIGRGQGGYWMRGPPALHSLPPIALPPVLPPRPSLGFKSSGSSPSASALRGAQESPGLTPM